MDVVLHALDVGMYVVLFTHIQNHQICFVILCQNVVHGYSSCQKSFDGLLYSRFKLQIVSLNDLPQDSSKQASIRIQGPRIGKICEDVVVSLDCFSGQCETCFL